MRSSPYSSFVRAMFALTLAAICLPQVAAGGAYTALPGDRVLLMNDDTRVEAGVRGQGTNARATDGVTPRWEQITGSDIELENELYNLNKLDIDGNLSQGTEWYHTDEAGNRTWHLVNVRMGNVFDGFGTALGATHNYLPWQTDTAVDYRDDTAPALTQFAAGQVVMRNASSAQVVSPLYAEGIGRIYFDAVNFDTDTPNTLQLEISVVDSTDEAAADWQPALVDVLAYVDGVYEETLSSFGQDTAVLAMTAGGSTGNFYRIVLNADSGFVNYRGPARFKISRKCVDGEGKGTTETYGMVLIDNIICSFPAMGAEIVPAGDYDATRTGEYVLGWVGALQDPDDSAALPYYGSTTFQPLATVNPLVNNSADSTAVTVSDAQFHYRWRYLTQYLLGSSDPCTSTNSSESTATDQANLSGGAVLNLPTVDPSFEKLPVTVSKIWLGNTTSANTNQIYRIKVTVDTDHEYMSLPVHTDTAKYVDNSWVQQYEFATPFEIRTGKDYAITFYDKDEVEITLANTVRLVRNQEGGAIQLKPADLAGLGNKAYNRLLGKVEYTYAGNFQTLPMQVDAGDDTKLAGTGPVNAAYTANPGDLEFYYTATVDAPYYSFVNYAGAGTGGIAANLEALTSVTTRRGVDEGFLPSRGADFFARLRHGRSELRDFLVEVRNVSEDAKAEFRTSRLTDDMEWCAFLYTCTNGTERGTCEVRFKRIEANNVTNYLQIVDWSLSGFEHWPETLASGDMYYTEEEKDLAWITIPIDGTTDFLRFRYLEDTDDVVITRADYQNFNGWNDAHRDSEIFVGQTTADGSNHGVSNAQIERFSNFDFWAETPVSQAEWQEPFANSGLTLNKHFSSDNTPGGWASGPGQYVARQYDTAGDYVALSMDGSGGGYLQYTAAERISPQGIGQVKFAARLAQHLSFKDFAVYSGDSTVGYANSLSNYTFCAKAVMGYQTQTHDGAASMSLVADYDSNKGCYEFRVTHNAAGNNYKCQLFRWNRISRNKVECNQLGPDVLCSAVNKLDYEGGALNFPAMFISVTNLTEGATHVVAGLQNTRSSAIGDTLFESANYSGFIYNDYSSDRLQNGTFGVASLNCPGRFAHLAYYPTPVVYNKDKSGGVYPWPGTDEASVPANNNPATFTTDGKVALYESLQNGNWDLGGWMDSYFLPEGAFNDPAKQEWGLKCGDVSQDLIVSLAKASTSKFSEYVVTNITSFAFSTEYVLDIYNTDMGSVRLSTGGEGDEIQTDLVVTDVVVNEWRGDTFVDETGSSEYNRQYNVLPKPMYTNVVFTECWVHGAQNSDERVLEMNASRAYYDGASSKVQSICSPLFDGRKEDGVARGIGLGMVAFSYTNCDDRVNLLVQVATNGVDTSNFQSLAFSASEDDWTTITNFSGSAVGDLGLGITPGIPLKHSGVAACYIGLHDVAGVIRVVMDPKIIQAAQTGDGLADPRYGQIFIQNITFRDEPAIDQTSWWGYNIRTGGFLHELGDDLLQNLEDGSSITASYGMSVALNNSVTDKVDLEHYTYNAHAPFVQTPTFAYLDDQNSPEVGELRIQARRYDTADTATARITIYGFKGTSSDQMVNDDLWEYLSYFDLDNNLYTNFVYQLPANKGHRAFRLAVNGVSGTQQMAGSGNPPAPDPVVRVVFDNVMVSETVNPKVKFTNTMAFHTKLTDLTPLDHANAQAEQPLTEESWGVQTEITRFQLPEEIDWSTLKVTLYWYENNDFKTWNASTNWANYAELSRCVSGPDEYIFRSSYEEHPDSVIPSSLTRGQVVQYHLTASYYLKADTEHQDLIVQELKPLSEWENPKWYTGKDYNKQFASLGASAYTILDNIAPGDAWINEVNVFGAFDSDTGVDSGDFDYSDYTNQYVEVAIPITADIEGWHLDFITMYGNTNTVVNFTNEITGDGFAKASKTKNPADDYVFLSIASPLSVGTLDEASGQRDGVWQVRGFGTGDHTCYTDSPYSGVYLASLYPLAVQLVRASGVVEHQITLGGTNLFTAVESPIPELVQEHSIEQLAITCNANAAAAGLTSKWFAAGYDVNADVDKSVANSLSVRTSCGAAAEDWTVDIEKTPGRKNTGQELPIPRLPAGDNAVIYCYVGTNTTDTASGRLLQGDGILPASTDRLILVVDKESVTGADIHYTITNYYEIASITTNGVPVAEVEENNPHPRGNYVFNVGKNLPSGTTITVRAWVRPWAELATNYGLDENNRYTPAVLDWLEKGTLLRDWDDNGNPDAFENPGTLAPAKFIEYPDGTPVDLSLTDMYCLDMDPTVGNQYLLAGLTPNPSIASGNAVVDFYMSISNGTTHAEWSPYVLRGATPGSNTQNATDLQTWQDTTLQINALLMHSDDYPYTRSVPVRWFVIDAGSFPDLADHVAKIEIKDQHDIDTPGYAEGFNEFSGTSYLFSWGLKDLNRPKAPEVLKPTNYYYP